MSNEIPRRNRMDLMTTAEIAITASIQAVELMPPDVRLTNAQILLAKARDMVADYVDDQPRATLPNCVAPGDAPKEGT